MGEAIAVGIGDCRWSGNRGDTLVTYALGSCIAIAVHDPISHVGGLLHFALPDSRGHSERAREQPFYFADTGIPKLFQEAYRRGAEKKRLQVKLAGGARTLAVEDYMAIGQKNYTAARRILWRAGVLIAAEDVGGSHSRTVRLEMETGRFVLTNAGRSVVEIGEHTKECR